MGRAASAVWNEVARNPVRGTYDPRKANHKAYVRRRAARYQGKKIVHHPALREEITTRLLDDQSPEAIAGYLARHRTPKKDRVSKNAIYRFLASTYGRQIETYRFLKKRRRYRKRGRRKSLVGRTFIDQRPQKINMRRSIGDAEADFIVSGKSGRGILLIVTDRKSRTSFLEQILQVSIPHVHQTFLRIKARFPEMQTVTTDNDLLFAHHKELEKLLDIKIYFCYPYHSWEKGTIENTNGVIRRDLPKGSDISRYRKRFFLQLEAKLNRRPMRILGFRTPQEVLSAYRRRAGRNKKRHCKGAF